MRKLDSFHKFIKITRQIEGERSDTNGSFIEESKSLSNISQQGLNSNINMQSIKPERNKSGTKLPIHIIRSNHKKNIIIEEEEDSPKIS